MKIAILTGGQSSERSVALASSKNIVNNLKSKYDLDVFDFPKDRTSFLKNYKKYKIAIPVFHGTGGEDGVVQGFLKTLGLPFIFSDVKAHSIALDKYVTKKLAENVGLLCPKSILLKKGDKIKFKKTTVVKPLDGGSSIGINIARSQKDLDKALKEAFRYSDRVLVEEYIKGKEFTVPIVESSKGDLALPVIEIVSKNDFFDYASKYDEKLVDEICPAKISNQLAKKLQKQALLIHQFLGAKHVSRSDFIVKNNKSYFLEINTIPGATLNSLLPKAISAAGENFANLLDYWIRKELS